MAKVLIVALGIGAMVCMLGCPPLPPDTDADPAAGRIAYNLRCAACHTLSGHDVVPGIGGDITGTQAQITTAFIIEHIGQAVPEDEAANLRAFVALQSQ
jgi:mono/diheme cytochrome c family protein